jgi:hypothetical protein
MLQQKKNGVDPGMKSSLKMKQKIASGFKGKFVRIWGPLMVAQWLRYCATNRKVAG